MRVWRGPLTLDCMAVVVVEEKVRWERMDWGDDVKARAVGRIVRDANRTNAVAMLVIDAAVFMVCNVWVVGCWHSWHGNRAYQIRGR